MAIVMVRGAIVVQMRRRVVGVRVDIMGLDAGRAMLVLRGEVVRGRGVVHEHERNWRRKDAKCIGESKRDGRSQPRRPGQPRQHGLGLRWLVMVGTGHCK